MVETHTTNYKTWMHILSSKIVALDYGQELELNSRLTIAKHTDSEDFGIFRTHDWEHLVTFTLERRDFVFIATYDIVNLRAYLKEIDIEAEFDYSESIWGGSYERWSHNLDKQKTIEIPIEIHRDFKRYEL